MNKYSHRVNHFIEFTEALLEAKDADPDYDVLAEYMKQHKLDIEQRMWLSFLFIITDTCDTALLIYEDQGIREPSTENLNKFTSWFNKNKKKLWIGKERGKHRYDTPKCMESYIKALGNKTQNQFIYDHITNDLDQNFKNLDNLLTSVKYIGPMAVYDWIEVLNRLCNIPLNYSYVTTIQCGIVGPCHGMDKILRRKDENSETQKIYNGIRYYPFVKGNTKNYFEFLHNQVYYLNDVATAEIPGCDLGYVETSLCKYNKFVENRYYISWEIDEGLGEISKNILHGWDRNYMYDLRKKSFDSCYLKENGSWSIDELSTLTKYKPFHFNWHTHWLRQFNMKPLRRHNTTLW